MEDYNDGKWHGWNGGECPVHPLSVVEAVWHDPNHNTVGMFGPRPAAETNGPRLAWSHVVKFRVVKEHREPKVWWRVGKHLHETKAEADQFLYRLRVDRPNMDFGPVVRVVEAEE